MSYRTDRNNNPIAVIVPICQEAGLKEGVDFVSGEPFEAGGATLYTAKFLGDPIATSIRVIDGAGYYTRAGQPRWTYIAIPGFAWRALNDATKRAIIAFHYGREGGTAMKGLFTSPGTGPTGAPKETQ